MIPLRVSVTTLESFRRVLTTEYAKEEELVAQIKGEPVVMPWYVHAGSAWQSVLEHPGRCKKSEQRASGEIDLWYESGGYRFGPTAVSAALERIGPGEVEVKATGSFSTAWGPVTIVAKADHVHGLIVTDNKFKASTPDARDYENSLQWRLYLLVHGAAFFRYLLYDFADPNDGYCELKNILAFRFWPYSGMEEECRMWLNRFLEWCDSRSLLGFLKREGTTC